MPSQPSSAHNDFFNGLVFGFDVGTASIGWAVRKGPKFLDVGVLICPEDTNDLSGRRALRRQRRTLRSKKYRRQWFSNELTSLGLPKPPPDKYHDPVALRLRALAGESLSGEELHAALAHLFRRRGYTQVPWANVESKDKNGDKPKKKDDDEGEVLKAVEGILKEMTEKECRYPCQLLAVRAKERAIWNEANKTGNSITDLWSAADMNGVPPKEEPLQRKIYWPRRLLLKEFAAICKAQAKHAKSSLLGKKGNRKKLLFGDTQKKKGRHVFFQTPRDPGVLGLRWPRFDNRGPGLDALEPYRKDAESGAWVAQHTLRRDNRLFKEWQLDVALNNFVVIKRLPPAGRRQKEQIKKFPPPPPALDALRRMWNERGHLWAEDLREWAKAYEGQFELHDPDYDLTPRKDFAGRARFSKHGMRTIRKAIADARGKREAAYVAWEEKFMEKKPNAKEEDIANGYARFLVQQAAADSAAPSGDNSYARTIAPPPVLVLPDESTADALRRYVNNIRDPRVRHRVELFTRELRRLIKLHNDGETPDFIVIEMARELMMNDEQKTEKEARDKKRKAERDQAARMLRDMGFAPDEDSIKKFLLAQEVGWKCPFTHRHFCQSDFSNLTITQLVQVDNKARFMREAKPVFDRLEIEHLVPRTPVVCNEWFNLTVTLTDINAAKRKRTPFQWLSADRDDVPADLSWAKLCENAALRFGDKSLKFQVFTSPDAARLIEENAKRSIQQTAYIARCLREACLIMFGKEWQDWTDGVGRDPRLIPNNRASTSFLTTNGIITSRLRSAWNLNEVLWQKPQKPDWENLTEDEKKAAKEKYKIEREAIALKNRQDHRHHAIDAMVIACTLPWYAYQTRAGNNEPNDGWCEVDQQTGAVAKIWNPIFNDYGYGIRRVAEAKRDLLARYSADRETDLLRHHKATYRNAQAFDTTPYGRREKFGGAEIGQTLFVARKRIIDLKTSHLNPSSTGGFIFSPLLREHVANAWEAFRSDEKNWPQVQKDWLDRFKKEKAELEAKKAELEAAGKKSAKEAKRIRAKATKIQQLHEMENSKDWNDLLKFIDKELNPGAEPQARFPAQFVATLRHPIYKHARIESVKVTAQSKDDDSFLMVREPTSTKARSGTYVMRKQEDKYREMRVYRLDKPGRAGAFVCWLLLPWYRRLDARSKRFKKVAHQFMPAACKNAEFKQTFRKDDIVCFTNDHLKTEKGIKSGESWRIVRTDAKGDNLANIGLLPAHQAKETIHPITGEKVKIEPKTVALNDFMRALEAPPPANELPHPPSSQPPPAGAGEARPASH